MSQADISVAAKGSGFGTLLRQGIAAHGLFLGIALAYLAAFLALGLFIPAVGQKDVTEVFIGLITFSIPAAFLSLLLYIFGHMAFGDRPESPLKVLAQRTRAVLTDPIRMAAGLPLFAGLLIFMVAFTSFKGSIPAITPFAWDATFDRWDTALHFGRRPYEWLQPILGFGPVTFLMNVNYNAWFFIMNLFWVHYIFMAKPGFERSRAFIAFMLITMLVGTVMAVVFSSAGPCYYALIGLSPDPYAPLLSYLHATHEWLPIWAVDTQDMLWRYQAEGSVFGGISAMPSVHNAIALLFVLVTWNKARWLRNLMIAHCVLIFLGSIHLGWHYAVDTYLAWPLTLLCWWISAPIARWWEQRPAVIAFNGAAA